MKNQLTVFILGLSFLLINCGTTEISNVSYPTTLKKAEELTLPLDDETSYEFPLCTYLKEDGQEYLYTTNVFTNGIDIYNLGEQRLVKRLRFPTNGPNSIRQIQNFTVINSDSIYVYTQANVFQTILVNGEGEVINSNIFEKPDKISFEAIINHGSGNTSPTFLHKKQLCFVQYPLIKLADPANINDEFECELCYDLETGKGNKMRIHFPKSYQNKIWGAFNFMMSRTKGHDDNVVYSWPAKDEIMVTNFKNEGKWIKAKVDNDYGKTPQPFYKEPEGDEDLEVVVFNYTYHRMHYDAYRNVYYRLALAPMDELKVKDYTALSYCPIIVIILNENFEKIGETHLPKNIYDFSACFVGEKGFYIPHTNPGNPNLGENNITYSIFKLQKKLNDETSN